MSATSSRIYPGWIVLAAAFTSAMLVIGGSIYIYQLFVIPVTQELDVSRGQVSYAYITFLVGMALWSPLVGRLYDRLSARLLMPLGGIAYMAGFAGLSLSNSPTQMLLIIGLLLGPAMVLAGGLAANTITARWFERRRGRALGIASVASSAGGFAMLPTASFLIENYGWRSAMLVLAIAIGTVIILLGLFIIRSRPDEQTNQAYDEFAIAVHGAAAMNDGKDGEQAWSFGALITSLKFWLITLGVGLLLASDQAILTSQFPFFIDIGLTKFQATSIVTAMTGSAIAGKLLVGFLAERFDIRLLYAAVAIFHILLLVIFLMQPGYWTMLIFVSIFGAAVGGIYPVWSVLVSQFFGPVSFGAVFGAMALFMQPLSIAFVRFIGASFDSSGSYDTAFAAFIGAVVIGIICIAITGRAATLRV